MGLKHQAAFARKWHAAIRQIETHLPQHLPPIWFLTDPTRVPDPVAAVESLPVSCGVIYRHFGAKDRESIAFALGDACHRQGVPFLIAADPRLAQAVGASGVHWPEAQLHETPRWRGRFTIQTSSAHVPATIQRARAFGLDAVLYSAVFPSRSNSAGSPIGPVRLRQLARRSTLPIYGLGGVNAANAGRLANIAGVAAIDGLMPK